MKRISVFCGSSFGTEKIYEQEAYNLGKTLAEQNIELVYGGDVVDVKDIDERIAHWNKLS